MEPNTSARTNRNERRRELKQLNLSVWDGATDVYPVAKSLDTSLKKNTAFIKRCRVGLAEDQQTTLLREVGSLSLEKYMSEVIASLGEGLVKCKSSADLFTGVEVASALHQRFGAQFSGPLMSSIFQGIDNPDPRYFKQLTLEAQSAEMAGRTDRHKIALRVLIELWMVGVFRNTTDGLSYGVPDFTLRKTPNGNILPPPLSAMKEVLDFDMKYFSASSIAVMVLKNYGSVLVGISKSQTPATTMVVEKEVQDKYRALLVAYTTAMQNRVQDVARNTRRLERRNEDAYIRTGKILDERKVQYDTMYKLAEEMTSACTMLSDYLGLEMPELRLTSETVEELMIRKGGTVFQGSDSGIWDDDEQRKFYEDLVDLTVLVSNKGSSETGTETEEKPSTAASASTSENGGDSAAVPETEEEEDPSKYESDDEEMGEEDKEIMKELDQLNEAPAERAESKEPEDDNDDDYPNGGGESTNTATPDDETAGQQMQSLLLKISAQTSREVIDEVAVEYLQLNNKASRNRILKFLTEVPLMDEYKLPFYGRFIATLNPICPDITQGVINYLDDFFRYLQRKRKVGALYQRRVFNVRYISELTKFGLLAKHVIFNKFKMMTERLDNDNVQSLANLLEGCGRYLLRKPETNVLMTKMLQILDRQKAAKYFSIEQKAVIDGALAYVRPDPDAQVAVKQKYRPPIEKYIRHLIYVDLSPDSEIEVLRQLRRMDWNDADTYKALLKVFSKIHKVKYANVSIMAFFLQQLDHYYPKFAIRVVDHVLESIRSGLELQKFSMNQQRISQVRYLGDLYTCGFISRDLMYETLYLLITFGHPGGMPKVGVSSPLDPPDEFFRIRLICTLLENPSVASKLDAKDGKLDMYLAFLQYYMFTKDVLSMDVQFQIHDVFELLRPKSKIYKTAKAAYRNLQKTIARANGQEVEDSDEEEPEVEVQDKEETEQERLEREEQERIKNMEARRVHAQKEDLRAAAEFERDFKKLMVDRANNATRAAPSSNSRAFDEPLPSRKVLKGAYEVVDTTNSNKGKTTYTLLTKKGTRQQVSAMAIPSDSKFAQSVAQEKQRRQAEHDVIKQRVLMYTENQNGNDGNVENSLPNIKQPELASRKYTRNKR